VSLVLALALGSATIEAQAQRSPHGLTAFRPQHGAGYFPFERTPVDEALEEDPELGPGIRVNGAGESDPAGEDDLIEVVVERPFAGAFVLQRSGPELAVWGTRTKVAGTELAFSAGRTAPLGFNGTSKLTVWVEWSAAAPGLATLALRALAPERAVDRLEFHAFGGLVVALGGEGQSPGLPLDPNHGTFVAATELYERGWDVLMRDEDDVFANGSGPVYAEVVNAIQHRAVAELAIFGYSHGGGSTYDLCARLDTFRATIGTFSIAFTSYVDGVQNSSDFDTDMELRRPIASAYHANHFQVGSFADFFLDGGPVPTSAPPPSGLNVEATPWGAGATHFLVDDYSLVGAFLRTNLELHVGR
jgi:hypothetical protein